LFSRVAILDFKNADPYILKHVISSIEFKIWNDIGHVGQQINK
jgi:hypothetical protein